MNYEGTPVEEDEEVRGALAWLSTVSGNASAFIQRLTRAQEAYRRITALPEKRGHDPDLSEVSDDTVGAYLAQAKSLLDDRRSFDLALASKIIPWLKQIGRNIGVLSHIPGAAERAARMLDAKTVAPESALFELLMASNYGADGVDVAFISETAGQAKTPDFRLSGSGLSRPIFVECKRLGRGRYETLEEEIQKEIFLKVSDLIYESKLSVSIDVTYTIELRDVPVSYLADHLARAASTRIITPGGYPWKDDCGFGVVRRANLRAVREDLRNSTLYFGTKMARLLSGSTVRENGYNLAIAAEPDMRDPRFIDSIHHGSVVTWQCVAEAAIQKKSRYVRAKLAEADRQLKEHGLGIVHLAMDMELKCKSSDLRREKNIQTVDTFIPSSQLVAVYIHYVVPRISESHAWLVDETVDRFGRGDDRTPSLAIFPGSSTIANERPAWDQDI